MSRFERAARHGRMITLLALAVFAGCQEVSVTAVPVERVSVTPEQVAVPVGGTASLTAQLHGSNGQTLAGRAVSWTSLNPDVATVDETGQVRAITQGTARIEASSEGLTGQATVTVTSGPILAVSPAELEFSGLQGGATPGDRTVAITNAGTGSISGLSAAVSYAPGQPTGWLGVSLSSNSAPATLVVRANQANLAPGTYSATVLVSSGSAANSPVSVPVRLTVFAPTPAIGLSSASVSFSTTATGPNPTAQTITITNAGGGTLSGLTATVEYPSGQAQGWLTATLAGATAPTTLTLSAARGSLLPGTYSARVVIAATGAQNSPQHVNVTFTIATVATPATIGLSSTTASFAATAGGTNPAAQTITITNTGGGTLSGLGATVQYTSGQGGWLTASVSPTTAPATLTLQATTGSLTAGTYSARVLVTAPGATNSPAEVTVTFTVAAAPPGAPAGLTASAASVSRIDLSWSSASGTVSGYRIERRLTAGGGYALVDSVSAGTTSYSDRNLLPLTGYTYRVQACGPGGCGAWSNETNAITLADTSPPGTPSDVTATRLSSTQIQLGWKAPGGQTSYEVRRRAGTSGSWTFSTELEGTVTSWIDSGLTPQTTYQYQIRACNSTGCSEYSPQVTISTSPSGNEGG
jgi:hypothetical protein